MRRARMLITTAAIAATTLGAAAPSASAFSISGGPYTATADASTDFTFGGGSYTFQCSGATYSGNATGSATTSFTPSFSGCEFFGFAATVTQSAPWTFTITTNLGGLGYLGDFHIPAGTTTTLTVPTVGCTVTISGTQQFPNDVSGGNGSGFAVLGALASSVSYTATGCPFSSGTGEIDLGTITFPGVTIS